MSADGEYPWWTARAESSHGAAWTMRLVRQGALRYGNLLSAVKALRGGRASLPEVLAARGYADEADIAQARAEGQEHRFVDLNLSGVDRRALDPQKFLTYARMRAAPWGKIAGMTVLCAVEPRRIRATSAVAARSLGAPTRYIFRCAPRAFERSLRAACAPELAHYAAHCVPAEFSARTGAARWQVALLALCAVGMIGAAVFAPHRALEWVFTGLSIAVAASALLRMLVLLRAARAPFAVAASKPAQTLVQPSDPRVTVLIALYREAASIPSLLDALNALDYPRELLDVKLLLEADDKATAAQIKALHPPYWVDVVHVPPGGPRTKPRALNAALPFARGEIIGVYDAEDRPEPDQIRKVVETFRRRPLHIVGVQARLAYYNARENWLTRCFAIEYACWFDVLLPGLRGLGAPIPLGGTSVFFRASALRELGGWDAHNVAEDADLGVRLARRGMGVEVVDSTTYEEANARLTPWVRQRSRWIKGYMQTWLTHMRAPMRTWRELGPWGFCCFQALILGGVISYLAAPAYIVAIIWAVSSGAAVGVTTAGVAVVLWLGQMTQLGVCLLATRRRPALRDLWAYCLLLPFYWPIGALAAYKALWEMIRAPFYWDKTDHGVSKSAQILREDALNRLRGQDQGDGFSIR